MAIYFIRHGQSEFNAAYTGDQDPMIFDAPLTELGFSQARDLRNKIQDLDISRVIASPLTRAIQTAVTAFEGAAPIEVMHGHHELLSFSGDVGRHPTDLKSDFPQLEFEHIPHRWWYYHPDQIDNATVMSEPSELFQRRVEIFTRDLDEMADGSVAIVGHGNVFKEITGFMMDNCQVHKYR